MGKKVHMLNSNAENKIFLIIFFKENCADCINLPAPNHLMSSMLIAEMSDYC